MLDIGGFHLGLWTRSAINLLRITLEVTVDYNPEFMAKMFIINSPFIFTGVWSMIKGWLDEKVRRKISIVGKNYLPQLLEWADEDQIPSFLGGTNPA